MDRSQLVRLRLGTAGFAGGAIEILKTVLWEADSMLALVQVSCQLPLVRADSALSSIVNAAALQTTQVDTERDQDWLLRRCIAC